MTAVERVRAAYRRNAEAARPEIWISLRPERDALADAARVDARLGAGQVLPLAGVTVAVKDNIDVAAMETTAGCPSFAHVAQQSAPCVARLVEAGAVVLGKTNLDQFATGLVGTRSPYGAVRDAQRPEYASGGSSSGSAVAVAIGIVDIGLGTDTAGSGRVPAAFQGIIGLKPTRGLIPASGVVPACRSFDCVSIFAETLTLAEQVLDLAHGPHADDPLSRVAPAGRQHDSGGDRPLVAVPPRDQLHNLTDEAADAFDRAAGKLERAGAKLVELDLAPYLEAGALLYGGAFVAERHAAVGSFVEHAPDADPVVKEVIGRGKRTSASELVRDQQRLDELRAEIRRTSVADMLLLPTTTRQPTLAAVARDPFGANDALGCYTRFANLLDLCVVAVPAGQADGGHFGVSVLAPAFADRVAADAARLLLDEPARPGCTDDAGEKVDLLVLGAHLLGQPLNHEITDRGGRLLGPVATAPVYRLRLLETEPPKPGLERAHREGASIEGELWRLPAAGIGSLLDALTSPMTLGRVTLADAREVVGFLAEPWALAGARDITPHGGWRQYLACQAASRA